MGLQHYTVEEYLHLEAATEDRNEFHEGEIVAMAAATFWHSITAANIVGTLFSRLRKSECRAVGSNMRVRTAPMLRYVYPDVSILCGGPRFDPLDPQRTTIINPRVIFEVFSRSTEDYDRGAKFTYYRSLQSLEEYVLVSEYRPLVEIYTRHQDGTWLFTAYHGIEATAVLRSIAIDVPLSEIYLNVSFAAPGDTDPSEPAG